MYLHDKRLQYPVKVDKPDPKFARMLQQAIGGVEGEIRVCMQYFFQAWGARGPTTKYRDMLLHTATEELGHIEMLATAVAMNLETAPVSEQEQGAADGIVGTVMGGGKAKHAIEAMIHKNILSSGLAAMPIDADGVPFNMSNIYASGNLAADMYCNVAAESTGRVLAVRLYNATDDAGMKDLLSFLIARDTMHQQQWLAVVEELGGETGALPIPNSFPQDKELTEYAYTFVTTAADAEPPPAARWNSGPSLDGKAAFSARQITPHGQEPVLGPARPDSGAQAEQIGSGEKTVPGMKS